MAKRLLIVLCLLLVSPTATAQTNAINSLKYQQLRARLLRDFIRPGTEPGMSMPARERWVATGVIRWADATIDFGWYMGMLATEYAMRRTGAPEGFDALLGPGVDTADELALAILALERIDEMAEPAFPECGGTPDINGFFIRDDVPADFHLQFGLSGTLSDFADPVLTNKEMSQDQIYHILFGLGLIKALVPDDAQARGVSIRARAIENAERIVRNMEADRWVLQNPACNRQVNRGHSALSYSPGTAAAIAFITDGAYEPETTDVAKGIWALGVDPTAGFYIDEDNLHMAMAVAAVGQGWGASETGPALAELARKWEWWAYPLAEQVMHRDPDWCDRRDTVIAGARALLDELPYGDEPYNPQPDRAVHSWTQAHRFIRGSTAYTGSVGEDGRIYHGVDYLTLHNLVALAAPELWNDASSSCARPEMPGDDAGAPGDVGSQLRADMGALDAATRPDTGTIDLSSGNDAGAGGCECATHHGGHLSPWALVCGMLVARRRLRRNVT